MYTICGITPAHAGKSPIILNLRLIGGDHPRTRGEKYYDSLFFEFCWGSPPHTRGKVLPELLYPLCPGITPAHAGKRITPEAMERHRQDHPRTRGEKSRPLARHLQVLGSPPHTRGKEQINLVNANKTRITPAHAGKSCRTPSKCGYSRDHPRTRGEK